MKTAKTHLSLLTVMMIGALAACSSDHPKAADAVIPPAGERDTKKISSGLDKGIEGNLDAALVQDKLRESVSYKVKNQVVTLTGEVDSQSKRVRAQDIVAAVPNVQQVVNQLQVNDQKATPSN